MTRPQDPLQELDVAAGRGMVGSSTSTQSINNDRSHGRNIHV